MFEERPLNDIAGPGYLTSTGEFAMHIRAIPVDARAHIHYESIGGSPAEKSDFRFKFARVNYDAG